MSKAKMITALLNLQKSFVEVSKAWDEEEISDLAEYPFHLEFDQLVPHVQKWSQEVIVELTKDIPDEIDNPVCLLCENYGVPQKSDGTCSMGCDGAFFPKAAFHHQSVENFLRRYGKKFNIDIKPEEKFTSQQLYALYLLAIERRKEGIK